MRLLLLLLLAQNLNQQPIESRQAGVRLSPWRQYVVDCRTGMTCATDGGVLYLSSSGGGGSTPTVTCATDEALTWNGAAWACISKIRAAWAADAGITAQYLPLTCGAGQFVTCAGTSCSCATPSGGGGSANFVSDAVTFSGAYDATKSVTAAWATSGSSIICAADGEEASVEGLAVTVTSKAAGSFTVRAEPRSGRHTGALPFTCTGN